MSLITAAWQCKLPLWKTFWLLHWLGTVAAALLAIAVVLPLLWLVNPAHDATESVAVLTLAAISLALVWNFFTMFLVWGNAYNTPHKPWRMLAQFYVIVNLVHFLFVVFVR